MVDLETGADALLRCAGCLEPAGDGAIEFVDAAAAHLAVLHVVGDSFTTTIHSFDPGTLTLGGVVGEIDSSHAAGRGHIAPDGDTVAALVFPELNQPSTSISLFNVASGEPVETWTIDGDAHLRFIDYDGRWIVGELSDGTTWVIDTADGSTRVVDTPARIRFG
ncbi:MAG: hypothetical protein P8J50_18095 [Acidimicrobiales bacterium]|nr:hypothetical protein [Acidimicrobiales bacterium]